VCLDPNVSLPCQTCVATQNELVPCLAMSFSLISSGKSTARAPHPYRVHPRCHWAHISTTKHVCSVDSNIRDFPILLPRKPSRMAASLPLDIDCHHQACLHCWLEDFLPTVPHEPFLMQESGISFPLLARKGLPSRTSLTSKACFLRARGKDERRIQTAPSLLLWMLILIYT
jgi:hypothetical protein